MNLFFPILFLVSLTLAEPPVGDGYPAAQSSPDHHHSDDYDDHSDLHTSEHQRSLSQDYGPPSASSRNAFSNEYSTNARSLSNARGQAHKHAPPTVRVRFNQRFSSAATRSSSRGHNASANKGRSQGYAASSARSGISQEYGPPAAGSLSQNYGVPSAQAPRSLSTEYGAPNTRSSSLEEYGPPTARTISEEYGTPSVEAARTPSTEYGVPNARSSPSEEYGAPVIIARRNLKPYSPATSFRTTQSTRHTQDNFVPARSQFLTESLSHDSHDYTSPSASSNDVEQGYDLPKPLSKSAFSSQFPSQTYGAPKSGTSSSYDASSSHSLPNSYEAPSARNSGQDDNNISQAYDTPNQRELPETYDAPSSRRVPSSRTNLKTDAIASSYNPSSSRSAPSSTYLPSARDGMPSQQYGVPEDDNKGYDYARARALDELLNQEPANYDFSYQIEDQESGSDFGHTETRQGNQVEGSYFVVLPDGTKQTVEYEADERGFQPRVSVEPALSGYESAADSRSSQGPY